MNKYEIKYKDKNAIKIDADTYECREGFFTFFAYGIAIASLPKEYIETVSIANDIDKETKERLKDGFLKMYKK